MSTTSGASQGEPAAVAVPGATSDSAPNGPRRVLRVAGRYRSRILAAVGLLALLGAAGYFGGRFVVAEYHYRAAETDAARGALAGAQAHLRQCLSVKPDDVAAHLLLAQTARRVGDFRQAEESLAACQRLKGPGEAISIERVLRSVQDGDVGPEREAELRGYVDAGHPETPLILEALARGHLRAGRLPQAMENLNRLLEIQPGHYEARLLRGGLWEALSQEDEALADYQQAVAVNGERPEGRLGLARMLYRHGRVGEAARQYEQILPARPGDAEVLLGLARCRADDGQPDEAGRLLDRLLDERPDDFDALVERGRVAFRLGDIGAAERWLRRSLAVATPDGETVTFQAILGRCDAFLLLARYLEADGRDDDSRQCLAEMGQLQRDLRRATELMKELEAAPRDAAKQYELGVVLLRLGWERQALRALNMALDSDPRS